MTGERSSDSQLEVSRQTHAVSRYFAVRYPDRMARLRALFFRRGEAQRIAVARRWLRDAGGLDVLDAGCGDGLFLARSLGDQRVRRLRIEDLVPKMVDAAQVNLAGQAERIDGGVTDVLTSEDRSLYDIVLALGLFDYETDWRALLDRLMRRARGSLIVDFAREGCFHHELRRLWLSSQGIQLRTSSRDTLGSIWMGSGAPIQIVELSLQWMVRIDCAALNGNRAATHSFPRPREDQSP